MNQGKYVFVQINSLFVRYEFDKCVNLYLGSRKISDFCSLNEFLCMMFGQLKHRQTVSDIAMCLKAQQNMIYHICI
jgi:hypothetical protein